MEFDHANVDEAASGAAREGRHRPARQRRDRNVAACSDAGGVDTRLDVGLEVEVRGRHRDIDEAADAAAGRGRGLPVARRRVDLAQRRAAGAKQFVEAAGGGAGKVDAERVVLSGAGGGHQVKAFLADEVRAGGLADAEGADAGEREGVAADAVHGVGHAAHQALDRQGHECVPHVDTGPAREGGVAGLVGEHVGVVVGGVVHDGQRVALTAPMVTSLLLFAVPPMSDLLPGGEAIRDEAALGDGGVAGLADEYVAGKRQLRGTDGRDGEYLVVVGCLVDDDRLPGGEAVGNPAPLAACDRIRTVDDLLEDQAVDADRRRVIVSGALSTRSKTRPLT